MRVQDSNFLKSVTTLHYTATVHWITDENTAGIGMPHGVKISWNTTNVAPNQKACRTTTFISGQTYGTIYNDEYPLPYMPNAQCGWQISVEWGYLINIAVEMFTVEHCGGSIGTCDYLSIKDGPLSSSKELLTPSSFPYKNVVLTSSNNAFLLWHTNGGDYGVGFGEGTYGFKVIWTQGMFDQHQ